jgi:hypothetical protein
VPNLKLASDAFGQQRPGSIELGVAAAFDQRNAAKEIIRSRMPFVTCTGTDGTPIAAMAEVERVAGAACF